MNCVVFKLFFFLHHFLLLFIVADLICMSCMFISIWSGQKFGEKPKKKKISIFYYIIFHLRNHVWIGWALLSFIPRFGARISWPFCALYIFKLEIDLFPPERSMWIIIIFACVCIMCAQVDWKFQSQTAKVHFLHRPKKKKSIEISFTYYYYSTMVNGRVYKIG